MHPVIETLNTSREHLKVQEELFLQSVEMARKERPSLAEKADGAAYALHKAGELLDESISSLSEKETLTEEDVFFTLNPVESKLLRLHETWSHFIKSTSDKSISNIMGGTVFGFDLALKFVRNLCDAMAELITGDVDVEPEDEAV